MRKNIEEQNFFARDAKEVANDLLGKFICCKDRNEKYLIVETEAYYYEEEFCYGHDKIKEDAKKLVSAPLFECPGTWCIYGGQLLLSVKDDKYSDNVLIKSVKDEGGKILGPDKMAQSLHLYKSKSDYCGCHGQYSLSNNSRIYLVNGQEISKIICAKRVNIKSDKELNFKINIE